MLFALLFNYKKDKTRADWLFVNFLTIQTVCILIYFSFGLPFFYKWMQTNDAVIYSFFIGGFLAMVFLWLYMLKIPQKTIASLSDCISNKFRTKTPTL